MKPQVHHIAIVVPEIEAALGLWRDLLGLPLAAQEHVPGQQSTVAFLEAGECQIELVRPDDADTGIARFLAARGPGLHHIALQVSGLDALLARLRAAGVRLVDETPIVAAGGRRAAFIHPHSANGVLVELYELPVG